MQEEKRKERNRVLLVDDQDCINRPLKTLMEYAGLEMSTALNGQIALEMIKEQEETPRRISLLITDLKMPVMTGVELIEEVRKLKRKIPILVISGAAFEKEAHEVIQNKTEGIIFKAFMPEELIQRAKEILAMEREEA